MIMRNSSDDDLEELGFGEGGSPTSPYFKRQRPTAYSWPLLIFLAVLSLVAYFYFFHTSQTPAQPDDSSVIPNIESPALIRSQDHQTEEEKQPETTETKNGNQRYWSTLAPAEDIPLAPAKSWNSLAPSEKSLKDGHEEIIKTLKNQIQELNSRIQKLEINKQDQQEQDSEVYSEKHPASQKQGQASERGEEINLQRGIQGQKNSKIIGLAEKLGHLFEEGSGKQGLVNRAAQPKGTAKAVPLDKDMELFKELILMANSKKEKSLQKEREQKEEEEELEDRIWRQELARLGLDDTRKLSSKLWNLEEQSKEKLETRDQGDEIANFNKEENVEKEGEEIDREEEKEIDREEEKEIDREEEKEIDREEEKEIDREEEKEIDREEEKEIDREEEKEIDREEEKEIDREEEKEIDREEEKEIDREEGEEIHREEEVNREKEIDKEDVEGVDQKPEENVEEEVAQKNEEKGNEDQQKMRKEIDETDNSEGIDKLSENQMGQKEEEFNVNDYLKDEEMAKPQEDDREDQLEDEGVREEGELQVEKEVEQEDEGLGFRDFFKQKGQIDGKIDPKWEDGEPGMEIDPQGLSDDLERQEVGKEIEQDIEDSEEEENTIQNDDEFV